MHVRSAIVAASLAAGIVLLVGPLALSLAPTTAHIVQDVGHVSISIGALLLLLSVFLQTRNNPGQ